MTYAIDKSKYIGRWLNDKWFMDCSMVHDKFGAWFMDWLMVHGTLGNGPVALKLLNLGLGLRLGYHKRLGAYATHMPSTCWPHARHMSSICHVIG